MDQKTQLMKDINETSFALNDITLYLDTHPDDPEAIRFFQSCHEIRKASMETFAAQYYPLTVDCINNLNTVLTHWTWGDAPAPWEGGDC